MTLKQNFALCQTTFGVSRNFYFIIIYVTKPTQTFSFLASAWETFKCLFLGQNLRINMRQFPFNCLRNPLDLDKVTSPSSNKFRSFHIYKTISVQFPFACHTYSYMMNCVEFTWIFCVVLFKFLNNLRRSLDRRSLDKNTNCVLFKHITSQMMWWWFKNI